MVICLKRSADDLHIIQLMVLTLWYWFTQNVVEKRPKNGIVVVVV